MGKITLFDKTFKPFIPYAEIEKAIGQVAERINKDFENSNEVPILLCTLNGAIMFTSELMKRLNFISELVTIKLSSYIGTQSSGEVSQVMGLTTDVKGRIAQPHSRAIAPGKRRQQCVHDGFALVFIQYFGQVHSLTLVCLSVQWC